MAQATVDLGLNTAAFSAGLNEAERRSLTFEGRIGSLFRRSPTQRAERAFTELATQLTSGNVAQALAVFATRLTGIGGLAVGVGIGAAVGLFQKFRSEIQATDKAARVLGVELATMGGARGPEAIEAKFKTISAGLTDLVEKSKSAGNQIANFFDLVVNPVLGTTSRGRGRAQASEIAAGFTAQGRLLSDRANAERRVAEDKVTGLTVSERQAKVDQILSQAAEKRSQVEEEATKFKLGLFEAGVAPKVRDRLIKESADATKIRKDAINTAAGAEIDAANRIEEVKSRQLDIDQDIAAQALRGVSAEDQKISRLEQELALIQAQLQGSTALTTENRKQLQTSQAKTQAELAAARAAASGRPVLSQQDIKERAKLTLGDIAGSFVQGSRLPFNLAEEVQFGEQATKLGPGAMARQALRNEEFARQAALRGDQGLAEQLFAMSDKLRQGIPGLKSAEKPISITDALQQYGKGTEIVGELQALNAKTDQLLAAWQ